MLIDNGYKLLSKEVRYVDEKDMGMFICKLRKENNMTQMELAQQLHVTDKLLADGNMELDIQIFNCCFPFQKHYIFL